MSFNPPPGKGCFTINAIVVDIGDHTIRTGKDIRRIEPKAMHVLYLLACNAGDTVERGELLRDVWNGRVVVEEALTRIISQLRQALGDSQQRRLIQTVPKKGYRLRGEVNWQSTLTTAEPTPSADNSEALTSENAVSEAVESSTDSAPAKQPEPQKALSPAPVVSKKAWFVAAVLFVLVAVVVFTLNKTITDDTIKPDEQRISVAVLPLRQLSNDDDTLYFADGITEELTDSLTQNQNLDVPSRYSTLAVTSSEDNSLSDVASSLGVRYLVEGSVRRIDEEFKIAVRLIDADTDRVVWSESYTNTASSLFAIQQTIARRLNEALLPQTSDTEVAQTSSPDNIEAYQYYLRGNYWLMNGKTSEWIYKSEAAFQQAVELAPDFAAAHGKLAYLYARHDFHDAFMPREEALQKADAAISKALRNNPQETNALLASVIIDTAAGNFSSAETTLDGILGRQPNHATALYIYSELELARNRFDAALSRAQQAYVLDPLSPWINVNLAIVRFWRSEYKPALEAVQNAISIDSNYTWAYVWQAKILHRQGQLNAAITSMLQSADIDSASEVNSAYTGLLYLEIGDEERAEQWFRHTASLLGDTPQARFWQGLQRFTQPQQATDVARQLMLDLPLLDNRIFSLLPLLYQNYLQAGDREAAIVFLQSRIADTAPKVNVHNYRFYAALQALTPLPDETSETLQRLMTTIGDNIAPLLIYSLLTGHHTPSASAMMSGGWLDYYWLIEADNTAKGMRQKLLEQRQQASSQRALLLP
ncbi:winged helix-turn-helix domain-containing protein [Alteromonas alba]|uniref:winged helix-turn-helix domain-containing protein n=1 Tax=Alteromonas alba TaxID=2079529 RepID=UPI0011B23242|nr:winged helix-turn-helix domain-containing protein [Alteromonas alba]